MSPVRFLLAAALIAASAPVPALAAEAADDASQSFAAEPLSDSQLDQVVGQGSPRSVFLRSSSREQAIVYDQQNAALVPVTFDNWFFDRGASIWNNVLAGR